MARLLIDFIGALWGVFFWGSGRPQFSEAELEKFYLRFGSFLHTLCEALSKPAFG